MNRILSLTLLAIVGAAHLYAQTPQSTKQQFNPHWYFQLQGGAGHTLGEADFGKLISPAAAISAGRQFTPVWALRLGVSGWEAKGARLSPSQTYKFNLLQANADVVVDITNLLMGFKYDRIVNPYLLVGVGGNLGFNNDQAKAFVSDGYNMSLLWSGPKAFIAGRAGVGVNFRLSDRVKIGLEVNTNMLPDKFNSKRAGNVDWQMNALAGVSFRIGKNHKKSVKPIATPTPAPIPAPITAPEKVAAPAPVPAVEQAPVAVQPAPAATTDTPAPAQSVVEQTPVAVQPAPATSTNAPAPPSPETYKARKDILFAINASEIQNSEKEKIEALVATLKANPKARISVVGYADAPTGSSIGNYWLSGWRAIRVRDALKSKGISASRIDMNFVGDRKQPYSDVVDNRVVICIVK